MKKFKHKTKNWEARQLNKEKYEIITKISFHTKVYNPELIPAWLIEQSNDWEEIKDYEILEIRLNGENLNESLQIWTPDNNDYSLEQMLYEDYCVESEYYYIHSVKRLSDGEVFTVGDLCNLNNGNGYRCPILRFELYYNQYGLEKYRNKETLKFVLGTGYKKKNEWGPFEIDICVHSKKPLFTTEDGVDIFEGDKYYYPTHLFTISSEILPIKSKVSNESWDNLMRYSQSNNPKFSTKEAAEEYILMNKKQFSLNNIKDAYKETGLSLDSPLYNELINNLKLQINE